MGFLLGCYAIIAAVTGGGVAVIWKTIDSETKKEEGKKPYYDDEDW